MGFSRLEYWNELPCPPPGDRPDPETEPVSPASPALQTDSSWLSYEGRPVLWYSFITKLHLHQRGRPRLWALDFYLFPEQEEKKILNLRHTTDTVLLSFSSGPKGVGGSDSQRSKGRAKGVSREQVDRPSSNPGATQAIPVIFLPPFYRNCFGPEGYTELNQFQTHQSILMQSILNSRFFFAFSIYKVGVQFTMNGICIYIYVYMYIYIYIYTFLFFEIGIWEYSNAQDWGHKGLLPAGLTVISICFMFFDICVRL